MRDFEWMSPPRSSTAPFVRYFTCDVGDRRRIFDRVAASLSPGGRFAWNVFCSTITSLRGSTAPQQNDPRAAHASVRAPRQPHRHRASMGRRSSLWWATKNEWEGLIEVAGLELEALYGWFDRRPLTTRAASSCG